MRLVVALLIVASSLYLVSQTQPPVKVGPLPDGGFLLNSGWVIRPAGSQVDVDTFPMRTVVSPDDKYLFVLNGGYNPPSISVISIADKKELNRFRVPDAWYGLSLSADGTHLYVGGGSKPQVYELQFDAATATLSNGRTLDVSPQAATASPAFIGDVTTSADGHLLYAADLLGDQIAVVNLRSGKMIDRWKCGRRPYRLLLTPDGHTLLVSSWADAAINRYDPLSGTKLGTIRVGPHPTDLLWLNKPAPAQNENQTKYIARLFVTAANTNNAYAFGVTAEGDFNRIEAISTATTPFQPLGDTPSALAIDRDGKRLYIVCSDVNAVAVADISQAPTRVVGFIPTGWYPTGAAVLPGGVAILNGKGKGSYPNPQGPNPTLRPEEAFRGNGTVQYVGHIQTGTVQFVPAFDDQQLRAYTETVRDGSAYKSDQLREKYRGGNISAFVKTKDHPSPIQHVIYVIKENRTYDQVLGDMPKGNGDKSLVLFGENVTPNHHKLAAEYVLYDNFYENADVSAEGHNWASAAIAPDYTVKMWPNSYAGRRKHYDYEGGEPANTPPAGYIWNNALQGDVTVRSYGEWVENLPLNQVQNGRQVREVRDPSLVPYVDMNYRGFDLNYPDQDRADEFLKEWKGFEASGTAPQLAIVRLGNDHTSGLSAGKIAPLSSVADNDYALGRMVDGVSHSKFWASTAILIIEDDAQNGPDHVDSHRAPAFIISPYTRRGVVDSTMYNQTSILRTIEGILGLHPMTQFDAAAVTMFGSFSLQPNTTPYTAETPRISLTTRNPAKGAGAAASAKLDFSDADEADDNALNAILWQALKGGDAPAPVRSIFSLR